MKGKRRQTGKAKRVLGDARGSPRIPSDRGFRSCVSKPEFYSLSGPAAGGGYSRHIGAKGAPAAQALWAGTSCAARQSWIAIKSGAKSPSAVWARGTFSINSWYCHAALASLLQAGPAKRSRGANSYGRRGLPGIHANQAITPTGTPSPTHDHQSPQPPSDTSAVKRPVALSTPITMGQRHRCQKAALLAESFAAGVFSLMRHRPSFRGARRAARV